MNTRRNALILMTISSASFLFGCSYETVSEHDAIEEIQMRSSSFESTQTASGEPIYIFFDPQCGHCMKLWDAAKKIKGKNFEWIPVGIFKGSTPLGAQILASQNPTDEFERIKSKTPFDGKRPEDYHYNLVEGNTILFRKMQAGGVPLIVWKKQDGSFGRLEGALDSEALARLLK